MMSTVEEIARRYGVTTHTVLGWIHRGELRALNVGRRPGARKPRWRIPADALADFEVGRTVTAPAPRVRRRRQADETMRFY